MFYFQLNEMAQQQKIPGVFILMKNNLGKALIAPKIQNMRRVR